MIRVRYTSFPGGGLGVALSFAAYVAGGLVIILFILPRIQSTGTGGLLFFGALWLFGLCVNGYLYLWRVSYSLESNGQTLEWRAVLRHGELAVDGISDVTSSGSRRATLHSASGLTISVRRRVGFAQFLAEGVYGPLGKTLPPQLADPNRLAIGFGSGYTRLD